MIHCVTSLTERARHWGSTLGEFWRQSARTVDVPTCATDWQALLGEPEFLAGPMDWGLALGRYAEPGGLGTRLTPLGRLVSACRSEGDPAAAGVLAALLRRWLLFLDAADTFDYIVTCARGYVSGPQRGAALIVQHAGRDLPVPSLPHCWELRSARAWEPDAPMPVFGDIEAYIGVHSTVRGRRLLLIEDLHTNSDDTGAWIQLLRSGGAARAGVMAICTDRERPS